MKNLVKVRDVIIGEKFISVQTMLSRKTVLVEENLEEIAMLKNAGCHIVRIAVSNAEDIVAFKKICEKSLLPIVSDIQYDYALAVASIEAGANKIRINPSNIGSEEKMKKVCDAAKANDIPIRIGVNMGSLDPDIEKKFGRTPKALAESCLKCASLVEKMGVSSLVLSVKASNIASTVEACRILNEQSDHPQHIGLTEAGTNYGGLVKNSIAIGALLLDGIGNTIRVSLSDSPLEEVKAGRQILKSLGLIRGVELISCPTCNRCSYDLFALAKEVEAMTMGIDANVKVAVMGCAVNGIGESKDADIGIVGGVDNFVLFKDKKIVANLTKDNYKESFLKALNEVISEKTGD